MITKAHVEQKIRIVLEMEDGDDVSSRPFAGSKEAQWDRIIVTSPFPIVLHQIRWWGNGHHLKSNGTVGKSPATERFGSFDNLPESVRGHVMAAVRTVADKMTEVEL